LSIRGTRLHLLHQSSLIVVCVISFGAPQFMTKGTTLAAETGLGSKQYHATPRPSTTPAPSPTPASTKAPVKAAKGDIPAVLGAASKVRSGSNMAFGIAGNMASLSAAEQASRLDGIKALGVGWVRYDIEWSNIEQSPGQYNWAAYDQEVQAIWAHGLRSLAIIDYTPAWARRADCSSSKMCAPADPNTYASFAGMVANRYKAYGVHDWEIWNEPNNVNFYQPAANPAEYTAMLRAAYTQIKQVDPTSLVLTGGTAPEDSSGGYLSPVDFVTGIYAAGGKGAFDAVAAHPYTWPYSPAWSNPNGAWGQMTTMHNVMASYGDGTKKIWITEFGAPTGGPGSIATSGFSTAEGRADHVTEALQARIVTDSINIEAPVSWIGPYFWYSYKDAGTTSDTVENFFGLLRADGSAKPSLQVFKNMVATH
jgi:hypothetical protein